MCLAYSGIGVPSSNGCDGLLIRLAGAVRGSGKRDHFEPRVVFQQRDETLADHTGGAENADLYLFGHDDLYDLRVSMG